MGDIHEKHVFKTARAGHKATKIIVKNSVYDVPMH